MNWLYAHPLEAVGVICAVAVVLSGALLIWECRDRGPHQVQDWMRDWEWQR